MTKANKQFLLYGLLAIGGGTLLFMLFRKTKEIPVISPVQVRWEGQ